MLSRSEVIEYWVQPLHMFGWQPTRQLCCGPSGSTLLRSLRRPDESHSAGFVITSSNRVDRPLSSKMVGMKTVLALERHRKVVLSAAFSFVTALTIAGC